MQVMIYEHKWSLLNFINDQHNTLKRSQFNPSPEEPADREKKTSSEWRIRKSPAAEPDSNTPIICDRTSEESKDTNM